MKDAASRDAGPALDFWHNEGSLLFPPSLEPSLTGNSCSTWPSEVESSALSVKSPASTTWEPEPTKWVRQEKIGQGAQGSIYRCKELYSSRQVAVKVIWTKELPPPAIKAVKREVKTMQRLRHRHLVRYLQATEKKTQSELRIYMEYAAGGSLRSHLLRSGPLSVTLVQRYTRQLCHAVAYLHDKGIAHRDIKCANILLFTADDDESCLEVKLADFGTFKVVGCASLVGGLKGTPHWMAPEVIRNEHMENDAQPDHWFRADVWSLGCAVLEMITGHSPWQQYSNPLTAMYQIVASEETPTIPSHVPKEMASFLTLCLQRKPAQRGTMQQLLDHPFVGLARDRKPRAKTCTRQSKHRETMHAESVAFTSNQSTQFSRSRKDPEPQDNSLPQSTTASPMTVKPTLHSPQSVRSNQDTRSLQRNTLQCVRGKDGGPTRFVAKRRFPSSIRLKALEPPKPLLLSSGPDQAAHLRLPTIASSLVQIDSAISTQRSRRLTLKPHQDFDNVFKRSATAPTSVIHVDNLLLPATIARLPSLGTWFALKRGTTCPDRATTL